MNKRWILLLISLVILLTAYSVYADNRFIGTQGETLDLKENCFNNNTYCSSLASCNLTVFAPDQRLLVNNQPMQNQLAYHNYTLTGVQTLDLGVYEATVNCIDNSLTGRETFNFLISTNGYATQDKDFTESAFFIGIAILLSIVIWFKISKFFGSFMIFIVGLGVLFQTPEYGWIGWIIAASGFIMLIYALLKSGKKKKKFRYRRRR